LPRVFALPDWLNRLRRSLNEQIGRGSTRNSTPLPKELPLRVYRDFLLEYNDRHTTNSSSAKDLCAVKITKGRDPSAIQNLKGN